MTCANLIRNILFSFLILLIAYTNVVIASQSINLNLSPSYAYVGETTIFTVEFSSTQNLSNVIIHFYVDAEKKGAKQLFYIEKDKKYSVTFNYSFSKSLYLGEHYIELKTEFETENQEKGSKYFYTGVNVRDNRKKPSSIFDFILFPLPFFVLLIGGFLHFVCLKYNIIELDSEDRTMLFNFMITILPISISIYILYFNTKPELKIGVLFVLLNFIASLGFALFRLIIAEKKSEVDANNFTLYSLCFLFLGLIDMFLLVLIF